MQDARIRIIMTDLRAKNYVSLKLIREVRRETRAHCGILWQ